MSATRPMPAEGCGPLLEVAAAMGPPDAILVASPSKSATHRAILLGALTPHTVVENALLSHDTASSLRLAAALGARCSAEPVTDAGRRLLGRIGEGIQTFDTLDPAAHKDTEVPATFDALPLDALLARSAPEVPRPLLAAQVRLHIERGSTRPEAQTDTVDLANSGTTLRIGTALAALSDRTLTLTGDPSLLARPMKPLAEALAGLGAQVECLGGDGLPPVRITGPLSAGTTTIRGDVSSQYVSALLIAAQAVDGTTQLEVTTPLKSAPYVDVTCDAIARFGGAVDVAPAASEDTGPTFLVHGPSELAVQRYWVPGDWSSAAFPLVAAAVTGGRVTLAGMDPEAPQGDKAVLDVLRDVGCTLEWEEDPEREGRPLLVCTAPAGTPKAFTHSFADTPDLFPPLAALAARCSGTSELVDAAHVRLKECDRVAAMAVGLRALEVEVEETEDALAIHGLPGYPLPPTYVPTHEDHRILMAFAVLGLVGPGPLFLDHPGCYHVSYPRFRMDIDALGGATRVVERAQVLDSLPMETTAEGEA